MLGFASTGRRPGCAGQGRVRCKHTVIAVAMPARGCDEGGEAFDEIECGEAQHSLSIGAGFGEPVQQLLPSLSHTKGWLAKTGRAQ